jgi:hypothetical protein
MFRRAHLGNVLSKGHYLLYCGVYFLVRIFRWRRRKRNLNIAFVNVRRRHEVKGPCARPSSNINDSGDMSDVYPRRNDPGMANHIEKSVLGV